MRNLKRVLSLAMALVMVLGMMVITTNAADFTDAEEITNNEAVDVMATLGILQGNPNADGTFTFNPEDTLTRAQAAKLICYMLGYEQTAAKLSAVGLFDDVAADHWASGFIAFCASRGYIAGNGDGTFSPDGELTDIALGKLVLGALGYDAEENGYVNNENWAVNITSDMVNVGLVAEVTGEAISREDACAMMLTAMKTPITASKGWYYEGLETVLEYFDSYTDAYLAAKAVLPATGVGAFDAANIKKDGGDCLLKDVFGWNYTPVVATADAFGRPGAYYDNGKLGTQKVELFFPFEADYVYTVTGLNDTTLSQIAQKLDLVVNGASMETAAKGDTVELYLDAAGKIYDAVKLHTELAQIAKVVEPTDEKAKYDYVISLKGSATTYKDTQLIGFDAETMVKDAYITMVKGTGVAIVANAEYVVGKQTATGSNYIKVNGEKMFYVPGAVAGVNYADTYKFFVDANGLIIGNAVVENEETKVDADIFYITESKFSVGGTFGADVAKVSVEYLDGTKAVLEMAITTVRGVKYVNYVNNAGTALATAAAAENGDYYADGFYTYTLTEDGKVATVAAVGTDHTADKATHVYLAADAVVSFLKGKANVVWNNDTFFADADTTVNFINTTGNETVTGYANFLDKDFTAADGVRALMEFDGDEVVAVYIFGDAFESVAAPGVLGYYISTGDTTYIASLRVYLTEVVYNVAGENVTYTIVGDSVDSNVKGFANIVVTDGIAVLTPVSPANEEVEKVTDSYIVIDGTPVYFASEVAYYNVTNVAKNGVVADDGVVVDDIIHYTTNLQGKITAVYTIYEPQEDGVLATYNAAYLTEVANWAYANAENEARFNAGDVTLIQYTASTAATGLKFTFAHESNAEWVSDYTWDPFARTAGETYVMTINWDMAPHNTWGEGDYTYTISSTDGDIYATGTFYYAG